MNIIGGAIAGTLIAAFIAFLWSRYGHRVNLARFFQVTAVFLLVFVVQLLIYGFHELAEANVLPNSEALHWATEPYGPDGVYGQYLTYLLVACRSAGWRSRACSAGTRTSRPNRRQPESTPNSQFHNSQRTPNSPTSKFQNFPKRPNSQTPKTDRVGSWGFGSFGCWTLGINWKLRNWELGIESITQETTMAA